MASTIVSAELLSSIAAMNVFVCLSVDRSHRRVRAGGSYVEQDLYMQLGNCGFLSRTLRLLFKIVIRSEHILSQDLESRA